MAWTAAVPVAPASVLRRFADCRPPPRCKGTRFEPGKPRGPGRANERVNRLPFLNT